MKGKHILLIVVLLIIGFLFLGRNEGKDIAASFMKDNGATTGFGVVTGGSGDDIINGHGVLNGGAGNDTISGNGTINGGDGNDILTGNGVLTGGSGDDIINVSHGAVVGGEGDDHIILIRKNLTIGKSSDVGYRRGDGHDTVVTNGRSVTVKMKDVAKDDVDIVESVNGETGYDELTVNMKDGSGSISFISNKDHEDVKSFLPDEIEFTDETLKFN